MFLDKLISFFKQPPLDLSKMTMEELNMENCHELEFGEYPNDFSREMERRLYVNDGGVK